MSKLELALEMARFHNRCGAHRQQDGEQFICYRLKNHEVERTAFSDGHLYEPVDRVIPFDIEWRPSDRG